MLHQVSNPSDVFYPFPFQGNAYSPSQPAPPSGDLFWALDDSHPAGPYPIAVHENGLTLLCLSMIRQALMDERYFKDEDLEDVRVWLSDTAPLWLKIFGYWRNWKISKINPDAHRLIKQPYTRKQPTLFDEDADSPWEP